MADKAQEARLEQIQQNFARSEDQHTKERNRWNRFHGLYHNYREWRDERGRTDNRDRDIVQMRSDWGADLFIPMTYTVIETLVPKIVAQEPRMTLVPPKMGREEDVEPVKCLLERQQEQMDFQLKLQDIGKSGLMYGLGVGKAFWRQEYANRRTLQQSILPDESVQWVTTAPQRTLIYDDPDYEAVDIWDFRWDPFGHDLRSCTYVFHITWRSTKYVTDMMKGGIWTQVPEQEMGSGSRDKFTASWADRMKAQGHDSRAIKSGDVHEIWEYHDGEKVCTVLNREHIVQEGVNPYFHGEYPFQIYRPTKNLHQFVGKSAIEPGEDLQHEMNTMRSQRRDNVLFALQRSFFFQEGLINPEDLKVGPGLGIPVTGDPNEVVKPFPHVEIPFASFREEESLNRDYQVVTGVSDQAAGLTTGDATATEAQLAYQQISERVRLMTKRLSKEVVRHASSQVLSMDQQRILTNRTIAVPHPPEIGGAETRWAWYEIGPEQLQGEWKIQPDDASMQPENVAQERQDGTQFTTLFQQNPAVDQRKLAEWAARKFGIKPEEVLSPAEPRVPPGVLDKLVEAGVPEELITQAWDAAEADEMEGERPDWPPPESQEEAAGGEGPPAYEEPEQNGTGEKKKATA